MLQCIYFYDFATNGNPTCAELMHKIKAQATFIKRSQRNSKTRHLAQHILVSIQNTIYLHIIYRKLFPVIRDNIISIWRQQTWASGWSDPSEAAPSLTKSASSVMVLMACWAAPARVSGSKAAPWITLLSSSRALAVVRMSFLERVSKLSKLPPCGQPSEEGFVNPQQRVPNIYKIIYVLSTNIPQMVALVHSIRENVPKQQNIPQTET